MTFEDPTWLHLSPALVLASAGLLALGFRRRSHLLARFAAPRLLEQLTERASLRRSFVKAALIVLAVAAISLALARPQYGVEWSQQKARGLDIVFALDSSKSMLATDLSPTRLDRAKLAILDLLTRLESDRIGLVAFAGQAFLQTPPTLDYAAFRESLEATGPSMLSRGGSDLGRALKEAAGAFPNENNVKVVLLLTDGEDLGGQALEAAEEAAEAGIQVFAIGVGTPEGTYLRVRNADGNEEFVRDNQGQPVRSQLDEATLQQIAQLTGGRYTRLNDGALDELYDSVLATLPREERESELKEVKIERFQWFLSAAICCLILERLIRRRNSRSAAARLLILAALGSASQTTPHTTEQSPELVPAGLHLLATAADHDDSTVDPAALAHEAMQNRDYAKALERYETAVRETADRMHQRDLLYNMGHAQHQIARQTYETGNLEQALVEMQRAEDYFKSAAEVDPHDDTTLEDAEKTAQIRKQIEQLLKQQQQEENQQKQNKPQDQQDEEENRQQDQRDSEQEQQNGQQDQQSEQQQEQDGQNDGQKEQDGQNGQQQDGQNQSPKGEDSPGPDSPQGEQSEQNGSDSPEEAPTGGEDGPGEEDTRERSGEQPQPADETSRDVPEVPGEQPSDGPGEDEAPASAAAPGDPGTENLKMSVEEAQVLLDSLRSSEEILPFTPPGPGRSRPLQDW